MLLAAAPSQAEVELGIIMLMILAPIMFFAILVAPIDGPTDCARARRRRKYENRCYREGRTYTPRPHLHVTGNNSLLDLMMGIDRRKIGGVPVQPRPPQTFEVFDAAAWEARREAKKALREAKKALREAKKARYEAAGRDHVTGLDLHVLYVLVGSATFAILTSTGIAVLSTL